MKKRVLLTILDGVGLRKEKYGNAFKQANTPNFDYLWNNFPHATIVASGKEVGLPEGQMGNSEVGHMNIGAGRIVYQPLELINKSISDGDFFKNEEILKVINHTKNNNSKLHIMGLISDGGVHSHINHLMAILDLCKSKNVQELYLHLFTDGRDVLPTSSYTYIKQVIDKLREIGIGKIASISGRYYAMDRDNNYDRLLKAYDVIINNEGETHNSIEEFIKESYANGVTDEFLIPTKFTDNGNVEDNDGIIVFNFRRDRLRELFTAITNPLFNEMPVKRLKNVKTVTMMPVVESVKAPYAFDNPNLKNILGEYLAKNDLSQLRIAETEKYAHVTFFFDGGKEEDYPHEKKILIPSPKVATYDLKPEMSCNEVTDALLKEIGNYDVIILNFANGDMLGHTGVLSATIKGLEVVDNNLGKIVKKAQEEGYTSIIIADHGNCEEMLNDKGEVLTSHTTNLVPIIVTDNSYSVKDGKLADIAPTILSIMGLEIPKEMTGEVLVKKNS